MLKRLLAVVAASVAVLGTSAGAALAEYPPVTTSGSVSASTVVQGDKVTFAGEGFAAGSEVTISVNDAVFSTLVAEGSALSLGRGASAHVVTAAFARPAAQVTGSSFSVTVTMQKLGANVLSGTGVDPAGAPRVVTAKVMVTPVKATTGEGSSLPFTGSTVIIPGAIVGLAMLAGGFLLLTSVRSRRAGARG